MIADGEHITTQRLGRKKAQSRSPGGALRSCVGCREKSHPWEMVRFVKGLLGELQVDQRQNFPGRGAYLHLFADCLATACKRRALSRTLGIEQALPEQDALFSRMKTVVVERFLERISLARRAGALVVGIEPVRRAFKTNQARFVCVASDASLNTLQMIRENARRKGTKTANSLKGSLLARAVGLDYLSVVAVIKEPFASDLELLVRPLSNMAGDSTRLA